MQVVLCMPGGTADKRQLKDPPSSPVKKAEEHRSVGLLCTSLANPSPSTLAGQSAVGKVSLRKAKITSAVKQREQLITGTDLRPAEKSIFHKADMILH